MLFKVANEVRTVQVLLWFPRILRLRVTHPFEEVLNLPFNDSLLYYLLNAEYLLRRLFKVTLLSLLGPVLRHCETGGGRKGEEEEMEERARGKQEEEGQMERRGRGEIERGKQEDEGQMERRGREGYVCVRRRREKEREREREMCVESERKLL